MSNIDIAREYIKAIEAGATGDALGRFFTTDVELREMPNRIAPHGSVSDLTKARALNVEGSSSNAKRIRLRICWRMGIE